MKNIIKDFGAILFASFIFTSCGGGEVKNNTEYKPDLLLNIKNRHELRISPLDIDQLYNFKVENYKVKLIALGSGEATDFGAYMQAYLVFDNGYEMPRRYALFYLGNFGSINQVNQISDKVFKLEGKLFSENGHKVQICDSCNVEVAVDISHLIQKEKQFDTSDDSKEGDIDSEIQVSIFKKD